MVIFHGYVKKPDGVWGESFLHAKGLIVDSFFFVTNLLPGGG